MAEKSRTADPHAAYCRYACVCGVEKNLRAEVESLRSQLNEARQDRERLDWLEQTAFGTGKALSIGGACYWSVSLGRKRLGEGDNIREAIDDSIDAARDSIGDKNAAG